VWLYGIFSKKVYILSLWFLAIWEVKVEGKVFNMYILVCPVQITKSQMSTLFFSRIIFGVPGHGGRQICGQLLSGLCKFVWDILRNLGSFSLIKWRSRLIYLLQCSIFLMSSTQWFSILFFILWQWKWSVDDSVKLVFKENKKNKQTKENKPRHTLHWVDLEFFFLLME